MESFEPEPRPKSISLRLVMEKSLTKGELLEYDRLDTNEALERAQALKTLHVEWSSLGDIANLEPFEAAEVLYLQYNRILRIENLDCLPRLQFLALQGNAISVLENLDCLIELEFLDVSKNKIAILDEKQLPQSVNILNLRENPCIQVEGYRERVRARLPDLVRLDGQDVAESGGSDPLGMSGALDSAGLRAVAAEPEELLATEKGLGAYWRKGEMQSSVETAIKERIEAFHIEVLGDVEGFDQRLEQATARSKGRRSGLQARRSGLAASMANLAASLSRPGTARLLEVAAALPPDADLLT